MSRISRGGSDRDRQKGHGGLGIAGRRRSWRPSYGTRGCQARMGEP